MPALREALGNAEAGALDHAIHALRFEEALERLDHSLRDHTQGGLGSHPGGGAAGRGSGCGRCESPAACG